MLTQTERLREASRRRRDSERVELRQAILRAAGEMLAEQGYESFSLRQVAERIGYSATTIYLHFKDKEDLLFAVVDGAFERFVEALRTAAAESDDPVARLGALGHAYVRFGLEHPAEYRVMFMQGAEYLLCPRGSDSQPRASSFRVLQDAVQAGIDAGALRPGDAEMYSRALWALVHGIVSLAMGMRLDPAGVPALTQTTLDMALNGLAPR